MIRHSRSLYGIFLACLVAVSLALTGCSERGVAVTDTSHVLSNGLTENQQNALDLYCPTDNATAAALGATGNKAKLTAALEAAKNDSGDYKLLNADCAKVSALAGIKAPTASTATPTAQSTGFTVDLTDPYGYTATLAGNISPLAFVSDITNSAPGYTDLIAPVTLTASLTNTTAGRTFPSATVELHLFVSYPISSVVCTTYPAVPRNHSHCFIPGNIYSSGIADLTAGESVSLGASHTMEASAEELSRIVEGASEAAAPALITALNMGKFVLYNRYQNLLAAPNACTTTLQGNGLGNGWAVNFFVVPDAHQCD